MRKNEYLDSEHTANKTQLPIDGPPAELRVAKPAHDSIRGRGVRRLPRRDSATRVSA
jgi:hypothetical protein